MRKLRFGLMAVWIAAVLGCAARTRPPRFAEPRDDSHQHYRQVALAIEEPDLPVPGNPQVYANLPPRPIEADLMPEYWNVSLGEAVELALANSEVLRDLSGTVIRAPQAVETIHRPALQEVDPRTGVPAALSRFDARFDSLVRGQKVDSGINSLLYGGPTGSILNQDLFGWESVLSKRSAVGTLFSVRQTIDYDANNALTNLFSSAWNVNAEVGVRQPLLQNFGAQYNRIAGPDGGPGFYNGVLVARTSTDISLAEFELGLRNFVSDVENAYWDLYYAYRLLDARIAARDAGLETWQRIRAQLAHGHMGADKEAQARVQYFQFQREVQNALTGRLISGTRGNNGATGGAFNSSGGVYVAERRLRLLLGLPLVDGRLIRPADEPPLSRVVFDWDELRDESLVRRPELRRQRWVVKRRELELVASRNFIKPRLDAVGIYRWTGFGHDLLNSQRGKPAFDNAFDELTGGDFQGWTVGAELSVPLGFRQGHTAVRHAELLLARERSLLHEQERQVIEGLIGALAEVDRAYTVAQTELNLFLAAQRQLQAIDAAYRAEEQSLFVLLDAQRQLAAAQGDYYRARVEYALAVKNVHVEAGTLLDYDQVYLAEGPWPAKAYRDAAQRERLRGRPLRLNYVFARPPLVSQGLYPQLIQPPGGELIGEDDRGAGADGREPARPGGERIPTPPASGDREPTSVPAHRPDSPVVTPAAYWPAPGAALGPEPLKRLPPVEIPGISRTK